VPINTVAVPPSWVLALVLVVLEPDDELPRVATPSAAAHAREAAPLSRVAVLMSLPSITACGTASISL
jgi:hypothetical protein